MHANNVLGKRTILIVFSSDCIYSLILCKNSKSDGFLEYSCNVEPEIKPSNFPCSVTLKSIDFFFYFGIIWWKSDILFHTWYCDIIHWSFGRSSKYWPISFYKLNFKNECGHWSCWKRKYWKTVKFRVTHYIFQNTDFHLKTCMLSLVTIYCLLFSLKWQGHFTHFLPHGHIWKTIVCQFFFQVKSGVPLKTWLVQLVTPIIAPVLFLK